MLRREPMLASRIFVCTSTRMSEDVERGFPRKGEVATVDAWTGAAGAAA